MWLETGNTSFAAELQEQVTELSRDSVQLNCKNR
jgi:hypothetical protein